MKNSLIEVREFPAVVQAASIHELRSGAKAADVAQFVQRYLSADQQSQQTLQMLLRSLAGDDQHRAFFVNGVFGSGKSHLLGILTLLGEKRGIEEFAQMHPHLESAVTQLPQRLAVYFSLDEYDGSRFDLEEITKREIVLQARRRGIKITAFQSSGNASRTEQFVVLQEELKAAGFDGVQLCVDELSLFLGAKDHRSLQTEASWLQFLGQCAARRGGIDLWCCFALQKEWKDVGELEPYSLSQVRDRFQTLTLSMAHLPSLVEHRLVQKLDEKALSQICHESFATWSKSHPQPEFGIAEWQPLYPFDPATVHLLEQVASRFFSRTRSAVLFCAVSLKRYLRESKSTFERISAWRIFDYFYPEFHQYAELRALDKTWQHWQSEMPHLAKTNQEQKYFSLLLKTVLLFRLAGKAPTAIQLANTLEGENGLSGEQFYEYVHQLLRRWSKNGDHLTLEKGEHWTQDRFSVSLGQSIQQTVRRHSRRLQETLTRDDARIITHLLQSCRSEAFPVSQLLEGGRQFAVNWHNSQRLVEVGFWNYQSSQALVQQAANWDQPETADVYLSLQKPMRKAALPDLAGVAERQRAAFLLWHPRNPTSDEWEMARESTARAALVHDPALRDNRRGRAVLKFLQRDLEQRSQELLSLMIRLYCEGHLTSADHRTIDIGELSHQRRWDSLLSAIGAFALDQLYPDFAPLAPAAKVLSRAHQREMDKQLLTQNGESKWWPASQHRLVRAVAAPLGLAKDDKGRWAISLPQHEMQQDIETFIGTDTLPFSAITAHLTASKWGLLQSQSELVICALLGAGRLEAVTNKNEVRPLQALTLPLSTQDVALRRATLLEAKVWEHIASVIHILTRKNLGQNSYEGRLQVATLAARWREQTVAEVELAQARLHQLKQAIDDNAALWRRADKAVENITALCHALKDGPTENVLVSVNAVELDAARETLQEWQTLQEALEARQSPLIEVSKRLQNLQLSISPDLAELQKSLQSSFSAGEKVLFDADVLSQAAQWNEDYTQKYREWHQKQYHDKTWQQLREIQHAPSLRALQGLSSLERYPFSGHQRIAQKIGTTLQRQCPRNGDLLPGEVCCDHCGLQLGQTLPLPFPEKITQEIKEALAEFHSYLHQENARQFLKNHPAGKTLLKWDGSAQSLLPLLDQEMLALLKRLFAPRRRFRRSFNALHQSLPQTGTKSQLQGAFLDWLEQGEAVGPDDEFEVIE